ncbi:type I methionyl aminopeptidase [Chryseolinea sp. H1M3-3]|uniref:type I methionyl aminopeptidase n=1 Tax=Chryseolinea sp. H1M3-3 TaxID=3034144 RepID=UPI0023EB22E6|nr:type I methionyl aminopeptidase [Chryseolinea sp. H1M3-3]
MVYLKTEEELSIIREGSQILGKAHGEVAKLIKPGIKTSKLDVVAEEFIRDHGGSPSFKNYNGFPASLCISVNDVVVHGFPGNYELRETDIISIDCGVYYKGYHSDSAYTYPLEGTNAETLLLLERTYESLFRGIDQAKAGNRIGDVSFAIQSYVESFGYGVVRELVGHGVGKKLHEDPEVPNYGKRGKGPKIVPGMVFAIEPMINRGTKNVVQERDGWTIRTSDRRPSAHFEHMVAVKENETEVLTTHKYIEENYSYKWRSKSQ